MSAFSVPDSLHSVLPRWSSVSKYIPAIIYFIFRHNIEVITDSLLPFDSINLFISFDSNFP